MAEAVGGYVWSTVTFLSQVDALDTKFEVLSCDYKGLPEGQFCPFDNVIPHRAVQNGSQKYATAYNGWALELSLDYYRHDLLDAPVEVAKDIGRSLLNLLTLGVGERITGGQGCTNVFVYFPDDIPSTGNWLTFTDGTPLEGFNCLRFGPRHNFRGDCGGGVRGDGGRHVIRTGTEGDGGVTDPDEKKIQNVVDLLLSRKAMQGYLTMRDLEEKVSARDFAVQEVRRVDIPAGDKLVSEMSQYHLHLWLGRV